MFFSGAGVVLSSLLAFNDSRFSGGVACIRFDGGDAQAPYLDQHDRASRPPSINRISATAAQRFRIRKGQLVEGAARRSTTHKFHRDLRAALGQ
jgi:hypothetical protein